MAHAGQELDRRRHNRSQYHVRPIQPVRGETNGSFNANLKEVLHSANGRAVGIHHNVGTRNGKKLDVCCCIELELEDGRITSGREHFYDLYAWNEFWS